MKKLKPGIAMLNTDNHHDNDNKKGVFTLTEAETETETDKKQLVWDCVGVFTLTETDTVTNVNGFQTHFIGFSLGVGLSLSV